MPTRPPFCFERDTFERLILTRRLLTLVSSDSHEKALKAQEALSALTKNVTFAGLFRKVG